MKTRNLLHHFNSQACALLAPGQSKGCFTFSACFFVYASALIPCILFYFAFITPEGFTTTVANKGNVDTRLTKRRNARS